VHDEGVKLLARVFDVARVLGNGFEVEAAVEVNGGDDVLEL
jgi:hypothetical protein